MHQEKRQFSRFSRILLASFKQAFFCYNAYRRHGFSSLHSFCTQWCWFVFFINRTLDNIDCVFFKLKHRTCDHWLYYVFFFIEEELNWYKAVIKQFHKTITANFFCAERKRWDAFDSIRWDKISDAKTLENYKLLK